MSQYHPNGLYAALYRCKALGVQCDSKPLPKKKQPIQKPEPEPIQKPEPEPEPEPEPVDELEPEPTDEKTEQSSGQSVNDIMARVIQYKPANHMKPKNIVDPVAESKKKIPVLKATTPRLDNVTIEKAAKYPIAQKAFLANRRPSQQALPDLSITVPEEPVEEALEDQTPVSTPPPVLVRQVRRAPTPPKRPVLNQAGTKPVAKK